MGAHLMFSCGRRSPSRAPTAQSRVALSHGCQRRVSEGSEWGCEEAGNLFVTARQACGAAKRFAWHAAPNSRYADAWPRLHVSRQPCDAINLMMHQVSLVSHVTA